MEHAPLQFRRISSGDEPLSPEEAGLGPMLRAFSRVRYRASCVNCFAGARTISFSSLLFLISQLMIISRVSTKFSGRLSKATHTCTQTRRSDTSRASLPTFIAPNLCLSAASVSRASLQQLPFRKHSIVHTVKGFATMGSLPETSSAVRVLILGGCYGGLAAAVNLLDLSQGYSPRMNSEPYTHHPNLPTFNIEITIVDERDGYYHLIGSPMALADSAFSKKNWVKYSDIPGLKDPRLSIIQGSVTSVDPASKKATISAHLTEEKSTLEYDYLVAATGLRRVWPVVPQSLTRKQYLFEAENHINAVQNAKHGVVVVGGGAVGIEMAAELKMVKPHLNVTLAHSRDKLLSSEGLPDETKDVALELLREAGVEVLMNHRLASKNKVSTTDGSEKHDIEFTNGHKMSASVVIMAISRSVPTTTYLPLSALDEDGLVKIKPNLQFEQGTPNAESHYAAGDITKWPGIKRCGGAMHQGHYVALNIHQNILSQRAGHVPSYKEIAVYPPVIGLAVGKKAVAFSPDTGTTTGEDVLQSCFRDDLGWTICWNYMQLGGRKTDEAKA
ncbi:unnamed protein product [Fusarium venenatum]|uniref:FAD/NAD(P)-binding domain-containing protein n=2 Tax=Fusarium venenatum TaxID=56646 RepID=A0A2L2TF03_9HYPO|nr:uncharacterized protein FVRRES_07423 [Fusarium venenatum]CEI62987.1 unnamed protein product [Fusarium venenatum]